MLSINWIIFVSILAFFIGGIPFGLIIGKVFKKIDIREYGSHNIGATNVGRVIGKKYAILTFLLDGLKSFLPVFFAKYYFGIHFATYIAFFVIMGHIFSPWLKGKGGKGISSLMLALLAIDYVLFLIMALTWLLCFKITKISALSALLSTFIMLVSSFFVVERFCFFVLFVVSCVVFYAHRSNIKRVLSGEELGFGKKSNNN